MDELTREQIEDLRQRWGGQKAWPAVVPDLQVWNVLCDMAQRSRFGMVALLEVLDALGAIDRPWELQKHGFSARRAEEICDICSLRPRREKP